MSNGDQARGPSSSPLPQPCVVGRVIEVGTLKDGGGVVFDGVMIATERNDARLLALRLGRQVVISPAAPKSEDVDRLRKIEAAAWQALHIVSARASVALPSDAAALAYKLAIDHLRDALAEAS